MRLHHTLAALMLLTVAALGAEAEKKPAFTQPIPEMKLTNGAVFRNVTVVRYEKERVVLKSSGGIGPLPYSYIPEPLRSQMIAERDAAPAIPKTTKKTDLPMKDVTGQMFVTTNGAGAYKFAGAEVEFYSKADYEAAKWRMQNNLPSSFTMSEGSKTGIATGAWIKALADCKIIAEAKTDSDGHFKAKLPADADLFLFAAAHRLAGGKPEWDLWVIDVPASDEILLSNDNQW